MSIQAIPCHRCDLPAEVDVFIELPVGEVGLACCRHCAMGLIDFHESEGNPVTLMPLPGAVA